MSENSPASSPKPVFVPLPVTPPVKAPVSAEEVIPPAEETMAPMPTISVAPATAEGAGKTTPGPREGRPITTSLAAVARPVVPVGKPVKVVPAEEPPAPEAPVPGTEAAAPGAPTPAASVPPPTVASTPPVAASATPPPKKGGKKRVVLMVVLLAALATAGWWMYQSMRVVSTDDAYVNGYVTFVAPRVSGQVAQVLVEDNNRVKKGDVLVQLDPEPYRIKLDMAQAALDRAQADLVVAQANVRSLVAQARSARFKLVHAMEDVDNQVALISERAAKWEQSKATRVLAKSVYDRAVRLAASKAVSTEDVEEKKAALDVAEAQVTQALEDVYQARVNLGLPRDPPPGLSLTDVPPDLDQTFSSVREALAELLHGAAQLGIAPSSYELTPKETLDEFYKRDPDRNIDRIYEKIIQDAPTLKQAQATVVEAQRDVDQAQLNLRYCTIVAEIDGVVTRRNVNPGNFVQVGQSLMAIRSLSDIWVDANFKETQLRQLRIGQHVDLVTDMYGRRQKFAGRISGFTFGTGSTLALLPPQNATGNFVKVVQRLPVRIDLVDYDPDKTPLFIGLSVDPEVDIVSEPTGPNAGKYLQDTAPVPPPAVKP